MERKTKNIAITNVRRINIRTVINFRSFITGFCGDGLLAIIGYQRCEILSKSFTCNFKPKLFSKDYFISNYLLWKRAGSGDYHLFCRYMIRLEIITIKKNDENEYL